MGAYFNPNNGSFTKDRNYKIYIDKTEGEQAKKHTCVIEKYSKE